MTPRLARRLLFLLLAAVAGLAVYAGLVHAGLTTGGAHAALPGGLLAIGLLVCLVLLPRLVARARQRPWIDVTHLHRPQNVRIGLILDVRTAADFDGEQGHIAGAHNIPLEQLRDRLEELGPYQKSPIAIVCRTDRRSAKAADLLLRQGFGDARVVRGGMTAWLEKAWPVEREREKSAGQ